MVGPIWTLLLLTLLSPRRRCRCSCSILDRRDKTLRASEDAKASSEARRIVHQTRNSMGSCLLKRAYLARSGKYVIPMQTAQLLRSRKQPKTHSGCHGPRAVTARVRATSSKESGRKRIGISCTEADSNSCKQDDPMTSHGAQHSPAYPRAQLPRTNMFLLLSRHYYRTIPHFGLLSSTVKYRL